MTLGRGQPLPAFAVTAGAEFDELAAQFAAQPTAQPMLLHQARAIAGWRRPERLRRLHHRTVVVHGSADRLMRVAHGRALVQLIPHAGYRELPGVGHLVPVEAPTVLLDAVRSGE